MIRIVLLLMILLSACSVHVIQTGNHHVECVIGSRVQLNSVIDSRFYELVFTRGYYELRLAGSEKMVARYQRCEIQITNNPPRIHVP